MEERSLAEIFIKVKVFLVDANIIGSICLKLICLLLFRTLGNGYVI